MKTEKGTSRYQGMTKRQYKVAKENHTSEWEYISGVDRKLLILK